MLTTAGQSRGLPRSVILLGLAIGVLVDVVVVILIATAIGVYASGGPSPTLNPPIIWFFFAGLVLTVGFSILLARHAGSQQRK